jgi:hypothetical protein
VVLCWVFVDLGLQNDWYFFRVWSIPTVCVKCVFEIKCYNYSSIQFLRKNIAKSLGIA